MESLFVVFEGIDGTGKSTLLAAVAQQLFLMYPTATIIMTREPTSDSLRQLKDFATIKDFEQDRQEHYRSILHLIEKNRFNHIFLCDRYWYSTLVYQMNHFESEREMDDYVRHCHRSYPVPNIIVRTADELLGPADDIDFNVIKLRYQKVFQRYQQRFLMELVPFPNIVDLTGTVAAERPFVVLNVIRIFLESMQNNFCSL